MLERIEHPLPDPGEGYGNVNAQLWGQYLPASNAGKSPFPIFPDPMRPPYNLPPARGVPTMDGFAIDYYANFGWEKGRKPSDAEMGSIGAVYTPATAPVINTLAQQYAVFTHWSSWARRRCGGRPRCWARTPTGSRAGRRRPGGGWPTGSSARTAS